MLSSGAAQRHWSIADGPWVNGAVYFREDIGSIFDEFTADAALVWLNENLKFNFYWYVANQFDFPEPGDIFDSRVYLFVMICNKSDAVLYRLAKNAKAIKLKEFVRCNRAMLPNSRAL